MKILKHGSCYKNNKIHCFCGCEFEYTVDDVRVNYSLNSAGTEYVQCPECGITHNVKEQLKYSTTTGDYDSYYTK